MNLSFLLFTLLIPIEMSCLNFFKRKCCFFRKKPMPDIIENPYANSQHDYLRDIEYKDTTRFVPPIVLCKVIKVYDGDTITVASKIPNTNLPVYRFSVRLIGIDSAEIKGNTINEKKAAIEARDALNKLLFGKMIVLKNVQTEKYGRILADVYLDKLHINQWLLDNHYAVPYDGGKKIATCRMGLK